MLTTRQQAVFDYIVKHADEKGYPPTVREIGTHFEIYSPNGVTCHLKALERKGYIRRQSYESRAITILKKKPTGIPLLGVVAAGFTRIDVERLP
jgi:repressor LexA